MFLGALNLFPYFHLTVVKSVNRIQLFNLYKKKLLLRDNSIILVMSNLIFLFI
jgi:hypothetical protein